MEQPPENQKIFEENKNRIEKEFNDIHKLFQIIENDILKTLDTKHYENEELYATIKSQIEYDNEIINRILDKHKDHIDTYTVDNIFNEETKKHIEIIKDNDEAKQLIERKLNQKFGEYQEHSVEFDEEKIEEIFELLKKSFTFKSLDDDSNNDNEEDEDEIEKLTNEQNEK